MAVSVDYIRRQYHRENVADFDLDEEESKEFQKLSLNDVPHEVPKKEESKEFQKLSLNDVPQVPKKKVDDGGKQLEQKPFAAGGNCLYTDLSEWRTPCTYSPGLHYANSLPNPVLIPDKTPYDYSSIPCTYSPLSPDWFKTWSKKAKDALSS